MALFDITKRHNVQGRNKAFSPQRNRVAEIAEYGLRALRVDITRKVSIPALYRRPTNASIR